MTKRILDFGCGKGYRAPVMGRSGEYYGVDISAENIDLAKQDFPRYKWILLKDGVLPFPDKYFDEAHAYDVLEHVSSVDGTLAEISRCLKPGANFIIEVPSRRSEEIMLKIHPSYWKESGHQRIIDDQIVNQFKEKFGLRLKHKSVKRGFNNLVMIYYFMSGKSIVRDTGDFSGQNVILKRLAHLFSEDFFATRFFRQLWPLWLVFPIWMFTLPLGRLISLAFPKSIRYELVKT
jgi:SAM-dependent methyltransferase